MYAVRMPRYGTPADLELQDIAAPSVGPGEALVRVEAAAVNPVDLANLAGKVDSAVGRAATALPRTAGRDYAGEVVDGPAEWIGEHVWGTCGGLAVTRDGTHAQYVPVPATSLRRRPENLSAAEAGAVGVSYSAAWLALARRGHVQAGETVLIVGASGMVGRAATQIAHWRGAKVIGADINVTDGLEVDEMIDTSAENQEDAVRARTGSRGVDLVFDTVGGPAFESSLHSLAPQGRHVVISSAAQPQVSFSLVEFYRHQWNLLGVNTLDLSLHDAAAALEEMRPGFQWGTLRPPRTRGYGLDEFRTAYDAVQAGSGGEKIVLQP